MAEILVARSANWAKPGENSVAKEVNQAKPAANQVKRVDFPEGPAECRAVMAVAQHQEESLAVALEWLAVALEWLAVALESSAARLDWAAANWGLLAGAVRCLGASRE